MEKRPEVVDERGRSENRLGKVRLRRKGERKRTQNVAEEKELGSKGWQGKSGKKWRQWPVRRDKTVGNRRDTVMGEANVDRG